MTAGQLDPEPVEDVLGIGAEDLPDRPHPSPVVRGDGRAIDDPSPAVGIRTGHRAHPWFCQVRPHSPAARVGQTPVHRRKPRPRLRHHAATLEAHRLRDQEDPMYTATKDLMLPATVTGSWPR